jgi:molybdopterin-containing oxidoreductase family iron-sulfur binding subunit
MNKWLNRREFLKLIGMGGIYFVSRRMLSTGQVSLAGLMVEENTETNYSDKKFGLIIDAGACTGCRQCAYSCKEENNIPNSPIPMTWIEVFEMNELESFSELHSVPSSKSKTTYAESPILGKWYLAVACLHCENPPCVKVCPVGATFKSNDGIVEVDYNKCIGCRQCMAACPYNARSFNWGKPEIQENQVNSEVPVRPAGVVEKCNFCQHRVREGRSPKCVEVCPVGARHFGDLNNPESKVSRLRRAHITNILLPEMNTKPNLLYITEGKKWLPEEER